MSAPRELARLREHIARRVRDLRLSRKLTQRELASRLDLSQSRLSELEQGKGSFSAEHFIVLQRIFNVTSHDLAGIPQAAQTELQNALARLGASHLHESEALPSERLESVYQVIKEAMVDGSPRIVTSVAPILARHAHELNLFRIAAALENLGLERRLGWVIDNTHAAIESLRKDKHRAAGLFRQGDANLHFYLIFGDSEGERRRRENAPLDVLDRSIRTEQTRREVEGESSEISKKWRIVTSIQTEDFIRALETADAASH